MKRLYWLFPIVIITILAGVLRFYHLDQVPISLYWDETAFGYNAYSILETGKDEYGSFLPLLLRSFDDYKLAGYAYLTVPFVWVFGLNEFSTRAASALFGTLTVLIVFFLFSELFKAKKHKEKITIYDLRFTHYVSIISSGLLAISPWHLQFSRAGFEANTGLFFIVLGAWLLFKGFSKTHFLVLSMISFGATFYIYRGAHVFVPILLLGFPLLWYEKFGFKKILISFLVFTSVVMPIFPQLVSEEALIRNTQVAVHSNVEDEILRSSQKIEESGNTLVSRIIYNRRLVYAREIVKNFSSHFSVRYLFTDGDANLRHGISGMGVLYRWEAPFLIVGVLGLLGSLFGFDLSKKKKLFLLLWVFAGVFPASLSIPSPHALRSLYLLPVPQIITAIGIVMVYQYVPDKIKKAYIGILGVVVIWFFASYLSFYYGDYKIDSARVWADGHNQMAEYVFSNESQYDQIIISGHYWKPYIFMLFYSQYDPSIYQDQGNPRQYSKYTFGGTGWGESERELDQIDLFGMINSDRVLVVFSPEEYRSYSKHVSEVKRIEDARRETMFIMGELDRKQ